MLVGSKGEKRCSVRTRGDTKNAIFSPKLDERKKLNREPESLSLRRRAKVRKLA